MAVHFFVAMNGSAPSAVRRGRAAAASREDVLDAAMHRYLRGRRIDVQAIAAELGLGRATIYRWFGSREGLIGEVLNQSADPLLAAARAKARGRGGRMLLDTFDRFNRGLVGARALRQFVEQERDAALRIICSSGGKVQPHNVAIITALIEEEVRAGNLRPAGRALDPRLRDRPPGRGLPLQRRRRRHARRRGPAQGRGGGAPRCEAVRAEEVKALGKLGAGAFAGSPTSTC